MEGAKTALRLVCRSSGKLGIYLPCEFASRLPPPDSSGSLPHCGAEHLSLSLLGGNNRCTGVVPRIYRVPEGTLVRGGVRRQEREGGGRNAPMANTQTDEFIKTVTANRAQLAKAGHHKEVWFYERRQREGQRC